MATGKTPEEITQETLKSFADSDTPDKLMIRKMRLLLDIDNFIKESVKTSGLNEIKAFQQKTVIDCLRQKFKIGK